MTTLLLFVLAGFFLPLYPLSIVANLLLKRQAPLEGSDPLSLPAVKAGIRLTLSIDQPVVRIICEAIGQASCAHGGKTSVKGKRALVTGGSAGLGQAMAEARES